jgi:hypothetical protein
LTPAPAIPWEVCRSCGRNVARIRAASEARVRLRGNTITIEMGPGHLAIQVVIGGALEVVKLTGATDYRAHRCPRPRGLL